MSLEKKAWSSGLDRGRLSEVVGTSNIPVSPIPLAPRV
jgi:hypothetical protein